MKLCGYRGTFLIITLVIINVSNLQLAPPVLPEQADRWRPDARKYLAYHSYGTRKYLIYYFYLYLFHNLVLIVPIHIFNINYLRVI